MSFRRQVWVGWVSTLALGKVRLFPPFLPANISMKNGSIKRNRPTHWLGWCQQTCWAKERWTYHDNSFHILYCMGCLHTFGSFPMQIHVSIYIYECVVYTYLYLVWSEKLVAPGYSIVKYGGERMFGISCQWSCTANSTLIESLFLDCPSKYECLPSFGNPER